jgi:hypothetical protein
VQQHIVFTQMTATTTCPGAKLDQHRLTQDATTQSAPIIFFRRTTARGTPLINRKRSGRPRGSINISQSIRTGPMLSTNATGRLLHAGLTGLHSSFSYIAVCIS